MPVRSVIALTLQGSRETCRHLYVHSWGSSKSHPKPLRLIFHYCASFPFTFVCSATGTQQWKQLMLWTVTGRWRWVAELYLCVYLWPGKGWSRVVISHCPQHGCSRGRGGLTSPCWYLTIPQEDKPGNAFLILGLCAIESWFTPTALSVFSENWLFKAHFWGSCTCKSPRDCPGASTNSTVGNLGS